jgi:hypothetical protein
MGTAGRGCPSCGCMLLYNGLGFSCISCAFTSPLAAGLESGPGERRKLPDRRQSMGLHVRSASPAPEVLNRGGSSLSNPDPY